MSGEAFFQQYVAKYGDAPLHAEYYECVLGQKAIKSRKGKPARMYVVLTRHRFMAMSLSKILKKPEVAIDCNWFDLRVIGNTQGNRLFLQFDGKGAHRTRLFVVPCLTTCTTDKEIEVVSQADAVLVSMIRTSIAQITAGFDAGSLPKLDMPADRAKSLIDAVEIGIAGGIVATYEALCDYHGVPVSPNFGAYIADVVARGETVAALAEMPGVEANSDGTSMALIPVLQAFAHNTYFTGLRLEGVARADVWRGAAALVRGHNQRALTQLVLRDTNGDARDAKTFFEEWAKSNARQTNALTELDAGGNKLSDAASALCDAVEALKHSVTHLLLGDCGLSAAAVAELAIALSRNLGASLALHTLHLDGARFDVDANDSLAFWLGLVRGGGALRRLSLVGCGGLEMAAAFRPLVQGASHALEMLDVSENKVDAAFLASQVIGSATALSSLRVADCGLTAELLDQLCVALGANTRLSDVELVAARNAQLGANAALVTQSIQKCHNVTRLDLRSCGFTFHGAQLVLDAVNSLLRGLRAVFVGGVGAGQLKKPAADTVAQMTSFGNAVAKAYSTHPALQEMGLDAIHVNLVGWRAVFGALASARVTRLVLSNAALGDAGMLALCEGLRVNRSLTSVELDGNRSSLNGLLDLRAALRVARHITHLPLPLADISHIQSAAGKPGSAKWAAVGAIVTEIGALVAVNASTLGASVWAPPGPSAPPAGPAALAHVPAELLPQHEAPPRYRDRKEWQAWKLNQMEAKLSAYTRAALAGGYVAGSGTSQGAMPPARPLSTSIAAAGDSAPAAAVPFNSAQLGLLSDLGLGDADDGDAQADAGYGDEPPPPPPMDDGYEDETINVSSKRAPPPPPSDY